MEISLDINKSVNENASFYFEKSKKAKHKLEGARKAVEETKKKLEKAEKEEIKEEKKIKKENRKLEWFENFRWFVSSEDFLVIGGKDATSNEIIIKKHAEKEDIIFHTDMAGSPFFVIKTKGRTPGESTLRETADATCTFSRAWKMGLTATDTFWVRPEQVTKEAKAGEYLAKGAFMIRGKTNYIPSKANLAIGLKDDIIIYGPKEAVEKQTKNYVEIEQGDTKKSTLAKQIQKILKGGDLDEIIRALPSGEGKIKN